MIRYVYTFSLYVRDSGGCGLVIISLRAAGSERVFSDSQSSVVVHVDWIWG